MQCYTLTSYLCDGEYIRLVKQMKPGKLWQPLSPRFPTAFASVTYRRYTCPAYFWKIRHSAEMFTSFAKQGDKVYCAKLRWVSWLNMFLTPSSLRRVTGMDRDPSRWGKETIGRVSEAGLHEWMPFVIFRARSREWSQRTSGSISE